MNKKLYLAIIKYTTLGSVGIEKISNELRIPINIIRRDISSLAKESFLSSAQGIVKTSIDQRLRLALLTIKKGTDIEKVCEALGWREFEDIVILILERNGFKTLKHFRFKTPEKRYEIDILGFREPFMLSIDCKRWKRSWQKAATIRVINTQVKRTVALIQRFSSLKEKITITDSKNINIIFLPLIVTLSETPLRIYEKVSVVPIFHFQNFLNEMEVFIDKLMTLKLS